MSEGPGNLITNPKTKEVYRRGTFLGKGAFAKCYEFESICSGKKYAGKVMPKTMLSKFTSKTERYEEIEIHSSMSHQYIVSLHSYFEDESNLYFVLELCSNQTLADMIDQRKKLTVHEVRYFMRQIVLACKYMHDNKVIHRDLKLHNLFISDEMEIRVGDFGLATRHHQEGKDIYTVCGTPASMAPEILMKNGYSFKVDIWSLGCIMYTLLVGSSPFRATTLEGIIRNIKKGKYSLPSRLDHSAGNLIRKLLHPVARKRPGVNAVLMDDFLTCVHIPYRIPTYSLREKPLFYYARYSRYPSQSDYPLEAFDDFLDCNIDVCDYQYFGLMFRMLESVIQCNPDSIYTGRPEDAQDPRAKPSAWIRKWFIDSRFGISYELCDNSIGMFFNDNKHFKILSDGKRLLYIPRYNGKKYCTFTKHPKQLSKMIRVLNSFKKFMDESLLDAFKALSPSEKEGMPPELYLKSYIMEKSAMMLLLSNGIVQVEFFEDHTKLVLCPTMNSLSFIDEHGNNQTSSLLLIKKFGCSLLLAAKLSFVLAMFEKLHKTFDPYDEYSKNATEIYSIPPNLYKHGMSSEFKNYSSTEIYFASELHNACIPSIRKSDSHSTTKLYATTTFFKNWLSPEAVNENDSTTQLYSTSCFHKTLHSSKRKRDLDSITELYALSQFYMDCLSSKRKCVSESTTEIYIR